MNAAGEGSFKYPIHRFESGSIAAGTDLVAKESPLEIRLSWIEESKLHNQSVAVTMRTPGQDAELALGFLFTEGIFKINEEFVLKEGLVENTIDLLLKNTQVDLEKLKRHFFANSSCGICGKASIEAIYTQSIFPGVQDWSVPSHIILQLSNLLRAEQSLFKKTGGIHGVGLFDQAGSLIFSTEDVGRHNALDKLIGQGFRERSLPFDQQILMLSGRASFELIQKAVMAGISMVVAVGAPSSLAIDLAQEHQICLIGFVKAQTFNIYSQHGRIK